MIIEPHEPHETRDAFGRLVIDIETAFCSGAELEKEQSMVQAKGNFKGTPEEIEAKKQAQIQKRQNELKDGLLDSNPIACIGVEADGELFSFSWFSFTSEEITKFEKAGIKVICGVDEIEMLHKFRRWLDTNCDESTKTVTWNGNGKRSKEEDKPDSRGFDTPKIRNAFARHGIPLPEIYRPYAKNWHIDAMNEYCRGFTITPDRRYMFSLENICKLWNIPFNAKALFKGVDVPLAIQEGRFYDVVKYNMKDVEALSQVADRMGF